jgi:hypothetical protein
MEINMSKAVASMVEMMLPENSPEDVLFLVPFEAYIEDYQNGIPVGGVYHLLFQRSSYISVFYLDPECVDRIFFGLSLTEQYTNLFRDKWKFISNNIDWYDGVSSVLFDINQDLEDKYNVLNRQAHNDRKKVFVSFSNPSLVHGSIQKKISGVGGEEENYIITIHNKITFTGDCSAAKFVASTCSIDELPLLINHENKEVKEIVSHRLTYID